MGKKRGKGRSRQKITRKSYPRKKTRQAPRRTILGRVAKTSAKKVGQRKQFQFNAERFDTNLSRKTFESPEFQAELLERTKKFRKKYKTTKTRILAKIRLRRNGKTRTQVISIGRAEFGDVNQRIEDTMKHLKRLIKGYAQDGERITRVSSIQLQRVTTTKAKKRCKRVRR